MGDGVACIEPGGPAALLTGYVGTGAALCGADELGGYIGLTPGKAPLVKGRTPVGGGGGVWP